MVTGFEGVTVDVYAGDVDSFVFFGVGFEVVEEVACEAGFPGSGVAGQEDVFRFLTFVHGIQGVFVFFEFGFSRFEVFGDVVSFEEIFVFEYLWAVCEFWHGCRVFEGLVPRMGLFGWWVYKVGAFWLVCEVCGL